MFINGFGMIRVSGQTITVEDFNSGGCTTGATASGDCSAAIGANANALGSSSISIGPSSLAGNYNASMTFGAGAQVYADQGMAIHNHAKVGSNGSFGLAIGEFVESNADHAYIIGRGPNAYLTNSTANSIMFGMNSTVPTMYIGPSPTTSSWGNVGIGTGAPVATLQVQAMNGTNQLGRYTVAGKSGSLSIIDTQSGSTATPFAPAIRGHGYSQSLRALRLSGRIDTGADAGTVPVMTFDSQVDGSEVTTRPLFEWSNYQSQRMTMLANGNLGIGTTTPSQTLHVAGTARINGNTFLAPTWGNVGIGTTTPSGKLHVNGTVFINPANVPAGATVGGSLGSEEDLGINVSSGQLINLSTSSIHFKDNVENIEFDREAFLQLRPVNFRWKEYYGGHQDVGLIAQEVAETFPALASWSHKYTHLDNGDLLRDSLGIPVVDTTQIEVSGVRYHKLPVYLLAIVKEQQQRINALQKQLEGLSSLVSDCCADISGPMQRLEGNTQKPSAKRDNLVEFILFRNDPNPFNDYTDIKYEHSGCGRCEIIITDVSGRIIKRLKTEGLSGTARIYASEIGAGLYLYSLVVDGQVVRTERMVSSMY